MLLVRLRPLRRLTSPLACHIHTTIPCWSSKKVLQKFKLADIGEGITECEVISWKVKPPGKIQAFDPLCEVQSDKASVEITSPFDGSVVRLLVQEGEVARVGEGLCEIEVDEEVLGEADESMVESVGAEPPKSESAREEVPSPPASPDTTPEASSPRSKGRPHPLDPSKPPSSSSARDVLATPSVRHFARQNSVDLAQVAPGSGKDGRVEKRDVEEFLAGAEGVREGAVGDQTPEADAVVELGRTRWGMWKAMEKSLEIPHFGYSTTLDLTALHAILPTLNSHIPHHYLPSTTPSPRAPPVSPSAIHPTPIPPDIADTARFTRVTYLPFLLKTLARAMHEWPLFRASITPSSSPPSASAKPTLTVRPHADISIALSTPTGLYTPTVQRADTLSVYALASRLAHLSALGRTTPSGLTPRELPKRGGTVSVSNVGGLGACDAAAPVLVPGGGVAIVAIGRAKWVWDVDANPAGERRLKVDVSWSADHRVVEGAELCAFVETWRGWVERPERLVGDSV